MLTSEYVSKQINDLVSKYDFPFSAIQDVYNGLRDCDHPNYAAQQLRYLNNLVSAGKATRKTI